jgi:RES domain
MPEDPPIVREAFPRTARLVSSARLRPPVLEALVGTDDIAALAEIEGATSARLIAEDRGTEGLDRQELVYGIPYAAFVNASFAYSRPREPNRFNASRGAWYAALAVVTCMREVAWHMADFLAKSGEFKGVVDYAEMFASMAGEFVDLRERPGDPCLDPDPAIGYPAGNALADLTRARGLNGIIYPSVRHEGGTCIAALWPHAVQSVAPGALYRFTWSGSREPAIMRISE